jgi:hypothetical protein
VRGGGDAELMDEQSQGGCKRFKVHLGSLLGSLF